MHACMHACCIECVCALSTLTRTDDTGEHMKRRGMQKKGFHLELLLGEGARGSAYLVQLAVEIRRLLFGIPARVLLLRMIMDGFILTKDQGKHT